MQSISFQSLTTNLRSHYKIIRNEGLFLPAENSFRPKFVTLLKEGGTSQVQKPCFIPPKDHFHWSLFWVKKFLGMKKNLDQKNFWFQEKFWVKKNFVWKLDNYDEVKTRLCWGFFVVVVINVVVMVLIVVAVHKGLVVVDKSLSSPWPCFYLA